MNKPGAIAGMLSGLLFTLGYIVCFKGVFMTPLLANEAENWLFGISPEGIGGVGMIINFAVALSVSAMTDEPPDAVRALARRIRTPR